MKKTKLILLQLFIAFVLISTSVYATVNTTIALSTQDATAFRGDTIDVVLSLKDVEEEKKIQSVSGYINYDKNVIEAITVDNIKKSSENKITIGNEILNVEDLTNADIDEIPTTSAYIAFNGNPTTDNDAKIVIDFQDGITEDTELITIKFRVKENATIGEVEKAISYSMFVVTAGSEESEEITKDIKLTVKAIPTENGEDGNNNTNNNNTNNNNTNRNTNTNTNNNTNKNTNTNTNTNNTNNNTNKNTNTNTNNNTNKNTNKNAMNNNSVNNTTDNTVSSVNIPAAGAKLILIPAIILIILAYTSYNRYIKYKNI